MPVVPVMSDHDGHTINVGPVTVGEPSVPVSGRVNRPWPPPECAVSCRQVVVDFYAEKGVEAHVTTEPPIVEPGYEPLDMRCPHGVVWFAEPTGDQIAKWNKEGL